MAIPNTPIVNAGTKYVVGLPLAKSGATTITIGAGAARDDANINDIILNATITVNGAVRGANGLDAGALANNTGYAVYLIGDSTGYRPTAGLLSLSMVSTGVALPFGYDSARRIGWVRTDGTPNILQFWQSGLNESRTYYYDVFLPVLTAGVAVAFANVALTNTVPAIASSTVICEVAFTAAAAVDIAQFLPFSSPAGGGANGVIRFGTGAAAAQNGMVAIPYTLNAGAPTILYKVTQGTDALTLNVSGFNDYLS